MKLFNAVILVALQLVISSSLMANVKVDEEKINATEIKQCDVASEDDYEAINQLYQQVNQRSMSDRDTSLYMSVTKAAQLYQNNQLIVVDIRRAAEFELFRIPVSINLPLHQIKHKSMLKNRMLLIVNDGKVYSSVEKAVIELLDAGFKQVKILNGGIGLWNKKVKVIDGQSGQANRLRLLSVENFLGEMKHGPWLVIDVSEKAAAIDKEEINGDVTHVPFNNVFSLNLNQALKQKRNLLARILFVSDDKQVYHQLNQRLTEVNLVEYQLLSQTTDYIPVYKKQRLQSYKQSNREVSRCGFDNE